MPGTRAAVRLGLAAYKTARTVKRLRTGNRPRGGGSRVVTQQHDVSTSRNKRKMPAQKKRWVKFVKKIDKAITYNDALCVLLENTSTQLVATTAVGSKFQNVVFSDAVNKAYDLRLGAFGSDTSGLRRFLVELRDKQVSAFSGANVTRVREVQANLKEQELYIKNSTMTLSIKNTTDLVSGGYNGSKPSVVYVDIYECVTRDDIADPTCRTAFNTWGGNLLQTTGPNTVNTGETIFWEQIEYDTSGCTPYQSPGFGKYWKILKRTRISIGTGQKANYTMSGFKGKVQFAEDMNGVSLSKGKVKDLIIIVNPTYNGDIVAEQKPVLIEWSKTYNFAWTNGPGKDLSFCGTYSY